MDSKGGDPGRGSRRGLRSSSWMHTQAGKQTENSLERTVWTHFPSHILAVPSSSLRHILAGHDILFWSRFFLQPQLLNYVSALFRWGKADNSCMRMKSSFLCICGPAQCGAQSRGPWRGDQAEFLVSFMWSSQTITQLLLYEKPSAVSRSGTKMDSSWLGRQRVRIEWFGQTWL